VIEVKWGQLRLKTIVLNAREGSKPQNSRVTLGGETIPMKVQDDKGRVLLTLDDDIIIRAGETLEIHL